MLREAIITIALTTGCASARQATPVGEDFPQTGESEIYIYKDGKLVKIRRSEKDTFEKTRQEMLYQLRQLFEQMHEPKKPRIKRKIPQIKRYDNAA